MRIVALLFLMIFIGSCKNNGRDAMMSSSIKNIETRYFEFGMLFPTSIGDVVDDYGYKKSNYNEDELLVIMQKIKALKQINNEDQIFDIYLKSTIMLDSGHIVILKYDKNLIYINECKYIPDDSLLRLLRFGMVVDS